MMVIRESVVKSYSDQGIWQICIIRQHTHMTECVRNMPECVRNMHECTLAYPQVWSNVVRQELVGPRNGLLLVVMQTVQRLKSCIIVIIVGSSIIIISIIFIFCPIVVIIIIPKHAQTLPHIFI